MTWEQVAEMQRYGMSFHSHSHHHVYLSRIPAAALERELRDSKRLLEDRLGAPVGFLAAPYGDINARVMAAALDAGYHTVCSSWSWLAQPGRSTLNRMVVYGNTSPRCLHALLAGDPFRCAGRAARSLLLSFPKALLLWSRVPLLAADPLESEP